MMRDRLLAATVGALAVFAAGFMLFHGQARSAEATGDRMISTVRVQITATSALTTAGLLHVADVVAAQALEADLAAIVARQQALSLGSDTLGLPGAASGIEEQLYAAAAAALKTVVADTGTLLVDRTPESGVTLATSAAAFGSTLEPIADEYLAQAGRRADRTARLEIAGIAVISAIALGVALLVGPYARRRRDHMTAIAGDRNDRSTSHIDSLTGLPERTVFRDRLLQAVHRASRGEHTTGLLVLAIDRGPATPIAHNDPDSDTIIATVARTLSETMRSSDMVARSGRDQFAILVDIRRTEDASRVAEKLLSALSAPIEPMHLRLTVSIGVAVAPVDTDIAHDLLQMATAAMLGVRRAGGNDFGFYAPEHSDDARGTIQIMDRLRGAVRRNEGLWLAYQPKVRVDDRSVSGYEALIRWRDTELGDMLPGDFIPIAEQNDLIVELGAWVIDNACRQLALWAQSGRQPLPVSVNVSPRQVRHGNLLEITQGALDRHGVDASLLELEITEAVMLDDESRPLSRLQDLRAIGISIAVDDFGTGYSSLSYLRQFPVNTLKIDRSFIQGLAPGSNDIAIAKTIIALGFALGLEVVAEGVETEEQLSILRDLGCDMAQGFLFSAPVPANALEALGRRPERETEPKRLAFDPT